MTIKLQAGSAVLGAGTFALVLLVISASQQPVPLEAMVNTVRVEYVPHPRQMVQIKGGQPFTVPDGGILVITAIGAAESLPGARTVVEVDGEKVVEGITLSTAQPTMVPLASGLTVPPGATVTLNENGGGSSQIPQLRAWGYLVRE